MHSKETQQWKNLIWKVNGHNCKHGMLKMVDSDNDVIVNSIGDNGVQYLCDMLKENKTLAVLYLDGKNWKTLYKQMLWR